MKSKPAYTAYAITLIGVMGVSAIAPDLPAVAMAMGISKIQAGLLVMFFTLPGIVFSPLTGIIADRFGRKIVAAVAIGIFGLSGVSCAFVDFRTMLFLRLIQGASASALVALSTTIIGDAYSGMERAKIIGYNASILTTGIAFYQVSGGILAHLSWKYPFFIFLLAFPVSFFVLFSPIPDIRSEENFVEYISSVKQEFNKKMLILFLTGMVAYSTLYGAFLTYFPFMVYDCGGNSITVGILQATMSISTAIFAANLTKFTEKLKEKVLVLGFAAYSISTFIILVFANANLNVWLFSLPAVLFGLAQGVTLPSLQHIIVSLTKAEKRAVVMSSYGSISKLGQTLGPLIYGFFSLDCVYLVASAVSAFVAILHVYLRRKYKSFILKI